MAETGRFRICHSQLTVLLALALISFNPYIREEKRFRTSDLHLYEEAKKRKKKGGTSKLKASGKRDVKKGKNRNIQTNETEKEGSPKFALNKIK